MPRPAGLARARRHVVGAHRRALADPQEREATVRSRNRLARGPGAPRVSRRMRGAERTRSGLTWKSPWLGLALGALVVAAITLILYPLTQLDPGVSSGVLYVLGVLLLTIYWGLWLGLLTSVASATAVAVFHGGLDSSGDVVAICVQLLTAVVASYIADRARLRAEEAEERIHLREVQASRARVLAAADAERR